MVSTLSIIFMIFTLLIAIAMPIALVVYFYKKQKISIAVVGIGALVFIVSQIATRIPMLSYLNTQEWYKAMSANVFALAVFLGLTAGLFEEVARYIAMKYLMKNRTEWKDGVAFGIGHGGIEAIILVGLTMLNYVVLSIMINIGAFESLVGVQLPSEVITQIKSLLVDTPSLNFLAGGYERIMAMIMQIAFSLIVFYSVRAKKPIYLLYAILLHGIVDSPLVIMASMKLNVWVMELFVTVCAAAGLAFIIKSKSIFAMPEQKTEAQ